LHSCRRFSIIIFEGFAQGEIFPALNFGHNNYATQFECHGKLYFSKNVLNATQFVCNQSQRSASVAGNMREFLMCCAVFYFDG
jgi:hypothetical protein